MIQQPETIDTSMSEPLQLKRGKVFQQKVYEDFKSHNKSGEFEAEQSRHLINGKIGRMDVLISDMDGMVAIYEIKATNWDRIKPKNIKKNAWSHQRQLHKYVETYIEEGTDVCVGIIYPDPPSSDDLRVMLEDYLTEYGAPPYWFSEIKGD